MLINGQDVEQPETTVINLDQSVESTEPTFASPEIDSIINNIETNIDSQAYNESYKQFIFVNGAASTSRRPSLFPKCALNYRLVRTKFVEYGERLKF